MKCSTIKYEHIAKTMDTIQIGNTVVCLYPIPNVRYAPCSSYINAGFNQCINIINVRNIKIEIDNL